MSRLDLTELIDQAYWHIEEKYGKYIQDKEYDLNFFYLTMRSKIIGIHITLQLHQESRHCIGAYIAIYSPESQSCCNDKKNVPNRIKTWISCRIAQLIHWMIQSNLQWEVVNKYDLYREFSLSEYCSNADDFLKEIDAIWHTLEEKSFGFRKDSS